MAKKKKPDPFADYHKNNRYWKFPVDDPRHTEVLGYNVNTPQGKALWDELDWSEWRLDGPEPSLFSSGGLYFHVRVKWSEEDDGWEDEWDKGNPHEKSYRWYRVRCRHAG